MPPKKYKHPSREEVNTQLLAQRKKMSKQVSATEVPESEKTRLFERHINKAHRKVKVNDVEADIGTGDPGLDKIRVCFTPQREKEVLRNAISYMVMLWVMTYRTLKERIDFVDISQWPSKLGTPARFIDQMWDECRKIEVNWNATYPTILGPTNPGWLFRKGCMPTEEQQNLRLKQPFLVETARLNCQEEDWYDFAAEGSEKDKLIYADLKVRFENAMYDREKPAGGKFAGFNYATGEPVSRCIVFKRVDGEHVKEIALWHCMNSSTADKLPEEDHFMGDGESTLFWPRGPTKPQNAESRLDSKRRKEKNDKHDETHHLSHGKRQMKIVMPHEGQLDHQEKASLRAPIDPDVILSRMEEMNARFESGAAQGLPGRYDVSDNFASLGRQRASDIALAKARLGMS